MVAGRLVRKARPHRGDGTEVPGEAAPQEGQQRSRGVRNGMGGSQELQGGSKGRSCMGRHK